ncbi:MAG: exodeoxyribonuclease V subunit gamma [Simkaniaceae bacterium]
MPIEVNLGNCFEQLAQKLGQNIYLGNSIKRKIIAVPSHLLRDFVQFYLADKFGACIGVQFTTFDQAVEILSQAAFSREFKQPSAEMLALHLEWEIRKAVKENDSIFATLKNYIWKNGKENAARSQALADHLASLFAAYGVYGCHFLPKWLKINEWKQVLFERVFRHLDYAGRFFAQDIESMKFHLEMHFFGINFIPKVYLEFFEKLQKKIPLHFYLFSPTPLYWGDLYSDFKNFKILRSYEKKHANPKQIQQLKEYLQKQNPLVANYAKLGQGPLNYFVEADHAAQEYFHEDAGLSLLHRLQQHLLSLKDPVSEGKETVPADKSIQLHKVPSKFREIEVLYHNLLGEFYQNSSLEPKKVLVMAPDISEYYPYIRFVFETGEYALPYAIEDIEIEKESPYFQAVKSLLDLIDSHLEVEKVIKLLSTNLFQNKFQISESQMESLFSWAEEMRVTWGFDKKHRQKILAKEGMAHPNIEEQGTWDAFFERVFLSFAMALDPEGKDADLLMQNNKGYQFVPKGIISFTHAEWVGRLYEAIFRLHQDMEFLQDKTLTWDHWIDFFLHLIDSYLEAKEEDEVQDELLFVQFLTALKNTSTPFQEEVFSFSSVLRFIQAFLSRKNAARRDHAGVKFCSLREGKVIPSDIIFLLGMNEEAFPRTAKESSLDDFFKEEIGDFFPKNSDFDRFAFLQVLHAAKKKLILSYDCLDEKDEKEKSPSIAVLDLLEYLDQAFEPAPSLFCIYEHPMHLFEKKYFQKDSPIKCFSTFYYLAATGQIEKKREDILEKITPAEEAGNEAIDTIIELQQLRSLARNPIKLYMNLSLQIYLRQEKNEEEKEFIIPPLEKSILKKRTFRSIEKHAVKIQSALGKMPVGIFKNAALKTLAREKEKLEIPSLHWLEIQWHSAAQEPKIQDSKWLLPSYCLNFKDKKFYVKGVFEDLAKEGLICQGKMVCEELMKIWPAALLAFSDDYLKKHIKPQVIFLHGKKIFSFAEISCRDALIEYVKYYELAKNRISLLHSKWIKFFLKENIADWERQVKEALESRFTYIDPYEEWLLKYLREMSDISGIFYQWSEYLRNHLPILYQSLNQLL